MTLRRLVHMGVKERQQIDSAFFANSIHALEHHFTEALACAHDVGGVDSLICTDQHESFRSVFQCGISGFICTYHIVLDRLVGTGLHQRHMLVGRRMIDDIRFIVFEHPVDASAVPHRTDQYNKVQFRIFSPEFLFDIIGIVLIDIKDDQLSRFMSGDLSAQLAADGTSAAGDQDRLPFKMPENLFHIYLDCFSSQQILHCNRLHFA